MDGPSSTFTPSTLGGASDATAAVAWDWLGWWPWQRTAIASDTACGNSAGSTGRGTSTHTLKA